MFLHPDPQVQGYLISFFSFCKVVFLIFLTFGKTDKNEVVKLSFYHNFVRLCDEVGKAPNVVARDIGGVKSSGTVTGWKKNGAVPRDNVLMRFAEYFNVSVEELLSDEETKKPATEVTGEGLDVIRDEIMPRVANLSQAEIIRLMGELAAYMQEKKTKEK